MKLDQLIQLLVVKEKTFFPLFKQQGENVEKAAELLTLFVGEQDEAHRKEIYKQIKEQEVATDKITGVIYEKLHNSFVTPFDREDIHELASSVDSVLDVINGCAKRILLYSLEDPHTMQPLTQVLLKQVQLMRKALDSLDSMRRTPEVIRAYCKEIRHLEGDADLLYEEYVVEMFRAEKNPITLIKCKSIIQGLEEATDNAKDVAGVLNRMIVKLA